MDRVIDLGRDTLMERARIDGYSANPRTIAQMRRELELGQRELAAGDIDPIDWPAVRGVCFLSDGRVAPIYTSFASIRLQLGASRRDDDDSRNATDPRFGDT